MSKNKVQNIQILYSNTSIISTTDRNSQDKMQMDISTKLTQVQFENSVRKLRSLVFFK